MDKELVFSGDCVLSLDDLGQFKDYTDTLDETVCKLKASQSKTSSQVFDIIKQILQADPEDTFYLPAFPQFLRLLTQVKWNQKSLSQQQFSIALKFEMVVIEECLLTLTYGEQILNSYVQKCKEYANESKFQHILLWMLFRLSQKVVFIEQYEIIATLWSYLDEKSIFEKLSEKDMEIHAAIYLECCQKFTRSRKMRKSLENLCPNKTILQFKIAMIKRNSQRCKALLSQLQSRQYFNVSFLKQTLIYWSQQTNRK